MDYDPSQKAVLGNRNGTTERYHLFDHERTARAEHYGIPRQCGCIVVS